jgi:hypothetical protein
VYDITSAARALGLRGKGLEGKLFAITLSEPSKDGQYHAKAQSRRGGSFNDAGGRKGRRGRAGFGKKKHGR